MRASIIVPVLFFCFALSFASCSLSNSDDDTAGWKKQEVKEMNFSFQYPKGFKILNRMNEEDETVYIDNNDISANENGEYTAPIMIRKGGTLASREEITRLQNKERSSRIVDEKEVDYITGTIPPKNGEKPTDGFIVVVTNPDVIVIGTANDDAGFNVENTLNELLESMDFQ